MLYTTIIARAIGKLRRRNYPLVSDGSLDEGFPLILDSCSRFRRSCSNFFSYGSEGFREKASAAC